MCEKSKQCDKRPEASARRPGPRAARPHHRAGVRFLNMIPHLLYQPTSYSGGPSGRLVLLRRRRRDVLADLLGDVRREHAVVPRAAQIQGEDDGSSVGIRRRRTIACEAGLFWRQTSERKRVQTGKNLAGKTRFFLGWRNPQVTRTELTHPLHPTITAPSTTAPRRPRRARRPRTRSG